MINLKNIDKSALLKKTLILTGFHLFLIYLGPFAPWMIVSSIFFNLSLLVRIKYKKDYLELFFPLSSGLLLLPMKLLYWDHADFIERGTLLLITSLFFSMVLIVRHFNLIRKFLVFFNRKPLKKRLIIIFITAEILFILSSLVMVRKGVLLGGDEPHYLVISQSIARDLDLNVFNQYARDHYREFVGQRLRHHARVGKGFKVWYSYGHLPGLSLTLAPFFLFKISPPLLYFLVRAYLGLFGALLAVLAYLFALKLWRNNGLALIVTTVFTLTTPVFFHSLHVFAELQAALLIMGSLYLLLYPGPKVRKKTLLAGFLLGITVFWGLKFALFIYLFAGGFFIYFVIKKQTRRALLLVLFPILFQLLFFGALYYAYGNLHPMSIYTGVMTPEQEAKHQENLRAIPLGKRAETLLGIFFDQRDGLLLYSPFYLLAFPGFLLALKKFRVYRYHLLISAAAIGYILFMGYSTVRAGYCPQARYLVPAAWMLMLFTVIYYRETHNHLVRKWFYYLPIYSLFVTVYQVLNPFTLYQSATHTNINRPGLMFQQWGALDFNPAEYLPSFVKVSGNFAYIPNLVFLALVAGVTLFSLKKFSPPSPTVASNRRFALWSGLLFALIFGLFLLFPRVPAYNPILLSQEGALPCKIYGQSPYPTRATERKFRLNEDDRYSYTLSTTQPATEMAVVLENNGNAVHHVSLSMFDRPDETVTLGAGEVQRIFIKKPLYKRQDKEYFYRVHLQLDPAPPGDSEIYVQLYPVGRTPVTARAQ